MEHPTTEMKRKRNIIPVPSASDWEHIVGETSEESTMPILPKEHPLTNTFSVGPGAKPETQRMAEEVVGFALGQTVIIKLPDPDRGTSPRYHGRIGTVAIINPADIEVGVNLNSTTTWFRPTELVAH